jgi:hypothetical protein
VEQKFLKFKLHTSKEKRIAMEFLVPSWVSPLPAKLILIPGITSFYLEATLPPLLPSSL